MFVMCQLKTLLQGLLEALRAKNRSPDLSFVIRRACLIDEVVFSLQIIPALIFCDFQLCVLEVAAQQIPNSFHCVRHVDAICKLVITAAKSALARSSLKQLQNPLSKMILSGNACRNV